MNVLVVAAHPDDEVLGCAGTIAKLAGEGHAVYIAILGQGVTSRYQKLNRAIKKQLSDLQVQSQKAAKIVGAKDLFVFDLPDNRFDKVALLDIVKIIEKLIKDLIPEIIYTHSGADLNIDHQLTCRAVLTATRPMDSCPVRDIYAFEVNSSTDWAFQRFEPVFRPNVFVDISQTLDIKLKAMSLYRSEIKEFPHPRSIKAIEFAAKRWGSIVGCQAAEAFDLIRLLR